MVMSNAGPELLRNGYPSKEESTRVPLTPLGQNTALASISGPTYLTAQTLVQQVAFTLSDKIFTYSPETFDLDLSVQQWMAEGASNVHGYTPRVLPMQTRMGAGSVALGYIFSEDFDLKRRHVPQTVLASSPTLRYLRGSLDQLSLLYNMASPFVAHVAAVDYSDAASGLVTDYVSSMTLAEDLGLALIATSSAHESQHMALLSTLVAGTLPTVNIYDGVNMAKETTRVIDVLDQHGLQNAYKSITHEASSLGKKKSVDSKISALLEAFNGELGTAYRPFEYHGHQSPESVLVVFGTTESSLASQIAVELSKAGAKVGVLCVRIYRPFIESEFVNSLPLSVKHITVLGQVKDASAIQDASIHSALYVDVLTALTFSEKWTAAPAVVDLKYATSEKWTPSSLTSIIRQIGKNPKAIVDTKQKLDDSDVAILDTTGVQQYTFWNVDNSPSVTAPIILGQVLSKDSSSNVTIKTGHDNLIQGGAVRTDIQSSKKIRETSYSIEQANAVFVGEEKLLNEFDILNGLKQNGSILIKLSGVQDKDVELKLPVGFRKGLAAKQAQLFLFDPTALETDGTDVSVESVLAQLSFLRVVGDAFLNTSTEKLAAINGSLPLLEQISKTMEKIVRPFDYPESWATIEPEVQLPLLPRDINVNSFAAFDKIEPEPQTSLKNWKTIAKALAFKEAYGTKTALRPDLSVKTYTVKVKENRRLTPAAYDRNIFHIEFDLGDSGLKYDIGEALGIHAENNEEDVQDFIRFYGLDPDEVVEVASREDPSVLEARTVYQSLVQNVDIFGRPPKRFYEALAEFATDENERKELLTLGGPEGATEFKRRAEVDTITYADILLEFPSAHPSFHDIVRIVTPMKRREYSIASSQKVTPKSVSLLIVVVSWVDPKGRDRFGQATRYLNRLKVGSEVTVSVKPSVMKLPAKSTQPLIMAGLGTGLAPFRAFVQYRAWQKAQGIDIGSVLLYMGSRHQREEYLYGEEWEAYQDAGVITLLGRAFSRDQPEKIYIQDRMRQTLDDIIEAYIKEEGAFYLCGPTWPVPDVTEVLEEAISKHAKSTSKKVDSRKEIERLKEELRYVLEVY